MAIIGEALETKAPQAPALGGRLATLGALGVRVGAAGLAYLLQIVLARGLGAAEYGVFSFAWSLVTIGGFLATMGYAQISVRFIAQYQAAGEAAHAHGFIRQSLLVTALGSALAVGGLLLLFPVIEWGWGSLCCAALLIGLAALPFFAVTDLVEGYARSQGWTIRALAPPYLLRGGGLMLLTLIAMAAGHQLDAVFTMKLALIATLGACIAGIALTVPPLLRTIPPERPCSKTREWLTTARPTLLSDLALLARQNIDLIVLGFVAPVAVVGIYFAATRIASLLGLIDFALGAAFGHRFARAAHPDALAPVWREAWWISACLGLISMVALIFASSTILGLFGAEFRAATPTLIILLMAGGSRLMIGPVEDLLTMRGHASDVWRANAAGAGTMLVGCLVLAPSFHAVGAALGSALGTLIAALLLARAIRKRLGLAATIRGSRP